MIMRIIMIRTRFMRLDDKISQGLSLEISFARLLTGGTIN